MTETLAGWLLIAGACAIITSYLAWVALAIIFGWQTLRDDNEDEP